MLSAASNNATTMSIGRGGPSSLSMSSNPAPSDGGCSDASSAVAFEREELATGEGFVGVDEAMERGPTAAKDVAGGEVVARPSSRSSRSSSFSEPVHAPVSSKPGIVAAAVALDADEGVEAVRPSSMSTLFWMDDMMGIIIRVVEIF